MGAKFIRGVEVCPFCHLFLLSILQTKKGCSASCQPELYFINTVQLSWQDTNQSKRASPAIRVLQIRYCRTWSYFYSRLCFVGRCHIKNFSSSLKQHIFFSRKIILLENLPIWNTSSLFFVQLEIERNLVPRKPSKLTRNNYWNSHILQSYSPSFQLDLMSHNI